MFNAKLQQRGLKKMSPDLEKEITSENQFINWGDEQSLAKNYSCWWLKFILGLIFYFVSNTLITHYHIQEWFKANKI